ncbi:hypothetical protein CBM2633_A10275 [Cupriavidus taiwanensis]|nr:hypothetical protein CBM2633_A10275 [Cupriavidus taiwanensis]
MHSFNCTYAFGEFILQPLLRHRNWHYFHISEINSTYRDTFGMFGHPALKSGSF